MTGDELEQRVTALEREHRLTRWYTRRVDRDLAEIATTQGEHTETLARIETAVDRRGQMLTEHGGRLDSIDAQLRSLTQMVGELLKRLTEPGEGAD